MEVRSLKNVDSETWKKFKSLAVAEGVGMAILLKIMVEKFEKNREKSSWDFIFNGEKLLNDSEAKGLLDVVSELRKEKGFRL